MPYPTTTWVDGTTPVNAGNLNKIELGLSKVPYGPDFSNGRIPVWNGSAWSNQFIFDGQIAPTAAIAISKLKDYPADGTKVLKGDGTWAVPAAGGADLSYDGDWAAGTYQDGDVVVKDGIAYLCVGGPTAVAPDPAPWGAGALAVPTYGTAMPASPTDGQEFILVDSLTAPTYAWRFRYSTAITDAYKWVFLGGCQLEAMVATEQSTGSGTYVDLATVGPAITLPRAGVWEIRLSYDNRANDTSGYMSYAIGATAAVDADAVGQPPRNTGGIATATGWRRKTIAAAATTLTAKYRAIGGAPFLNRQIAAVPVRVA